jgi:hypothetical protein
MPFRSLILVLLALGLSVAPAAQRVLPYPVTPPPPYQRAIAEGTRTLSGSPGPSYWQNRADYDLSARLDVDTDRVTGSGTITYTNVSPDDLSFLVLKLRQNVHAPGVQRNRPVAVTGGMALRDFSVNGSGYSDVTDPDTPGAYQGTVEPGQYAIFGTVMTVGLQEPLASGETATIDVDWDYTVPPAGGTFRQGTDGDVYYLGYWYPTVAVYDDVYGWHTDPYLGMGEHYLEFGDFSVEFDAPADMLVYGTGRLVNADQVYTPQTRERLDAALAGDGVVRVVTEADRAAALAPALDGRRVWRFEAEDVRDVALSASASYVWDATRALVDRDGDGTAGDAVLINSFYRPGTAAWARSAEFAAFSIEHLSEILWPYPWPHMTAVEGVIGGGMEYPMMTLIGGDRTDPSLFSVTYHEIVHMWFPMMVGSNEKAYTWMDEGLTSFLTNEGVDVFWDGSAPDRERIDAWDRRRQSHYLLAGTGYPVPPMRHNDRFPVGGGTRQVDPVGGAARGVASYSTPAVALHALRGLYGDAEFFEALRRYGRAWRGAHPYPYDFFQSMEDGLGEDLDWFWTPTFFDTWTVDHGIATVTSGPGAEVVVRIVDGGMAPMPAVARVTYADGNTVDERVPVETWLGGAVEATLRFPAGEVARVELDPDGYIFDADPTNDVWEPEEPATGAEDAGSGR